MSLIYLHRDYRSGPSEYGSYGSCDWVNSASGARCLIVGGRWSNGARAGVANANANNALSISNNNVGSRLAQSHLTKLTLGPDRALIRQKNSINHNLPAGRAYPNAGTRFSFREAAP